MIDYAFLLQFVVNGVAYANLLAHEKGVTDFARLRKISAIKKRHKALLSSKDILHYLWASIKL